LNKKLLVSKYYRSISYIHVKFNKLKCELKIALNLSISLNSNLLRSYDICGIKSFIRHEITIAQTKLAVQTLKVHTVQFKNSLHAQGHVVDAG